MQTNKIIVNNKRPIGWLLILSVLLITVLPAHFHLHHISTEENNSVVALTQQDHEHLVELHLATDGSGSTHHDDVVKIEATPDGVIKKISKMTPFLILAILLVLVPVSVFQVYTRFYPSKSKLKTNYEYFSPLLRAPPLS